LSIPFIFQKKGKILLDFSFKNGLIYLLFSWIGKGLFQPFLDPNFFATGVILKRGEEELFSRFFKNEFYDG